MICLWQNSFPANIHILLPHRDLQSREGVGAEEDEWNVKEDDRMETSRVFHSAVIQIETAEE